MTSPILIVGQGLAGTMLGWELERNGADFQLVDARGSGGAAGVAASSVAAGIINPITGQRLVKSWRVDELLPLARESFRELEAAWGVRVWRDMRVRREWRNEDEKRVYAEKLSRGELAPFAGEADENGFWIEGAAHVDVPKLMQAARERWRRNGRLVELSAADEARRAHGNPTIVCTGAELRREPALAFVPWAVAKGEILTVSATLLASDVIRNRGHWLLPITEKWGKIGATYLPGEDDTFPSESARIALLQSAARLVSGPFAVESHDCGLRLTLPDKHPVVGRVPHKNNLGVLGGLGSKGVLLAPWLARQWWNHLAEGVPFDPAVDLARYWPKPGPALASQDDRGSS